MTILDLRTEGEYWGKTLRTLRGGHIPGAILGRPADLQGGEAPLVVYGHRTFDGLIGLTALVVRGLNPKVLMEGWAGWATDGSLPVDAATFAGTPKRKKKVAQVQPTETFDKTRLLIAGAVLALGAFAAGYFARSLKPGNKA